MTCTSFAEGTAAEKSFRDPRIVDGHGDRISDSDTLVVYRGLVRGGFARVPSHRARQLAEIKKRGVGGDHLVVHIARRGGGLFGAFLVLINRRPAPALGLGQQKQSRPASGWERALVIQLREVPPPLRRLVTGKRRRHGAENGYEQGQGTLRKDDLARFGYVFGAASPRTGRFLPGAFSFHRGKIECKPYRSTSLLGLRRGFMNLNTYLPIAANNARRPWRIHVLRQSPRIRAIFLKSACACPTEEVRYARVARP